MPKLFTTNGRDARGADNPRGGARGAGRQMAQAPKGRGRRRGRKPPSRAGQTHGHGQPPRIARLAN